MTLSTNKFSNPVTQKFTRRQFWLSVAVSSLMLTVALPSFAETAPTTQLSASQSDDGIMAIVGDTPILKSEVNQAVATAYAQLQAQANGQPTPTREQLQGEVLNALILKQLQLDLVKRAGIRPNPDAVNNQLAQIAQNQGLASIEQLQQRMDSQRAGSYAELRNQLLEEASLKALSQRQIASRVRITDQDIEAFLASPESQKLSQTEYRTIHIRVPYIDDYSRISETDREQALQVANEARALLAETDDANEVMTKLSEGSAKDYPVNVQGGDMGFHPASGLPTTIANDITGLKTGEVTEPQVTPSGVDVVKLVATRGSEDMIIPQWRVRHILVKPDSIQGSAIAEQEINDLYEQLRRDADFASLASTYSDDTGSAGRGGDLDWVSEGQMVPEFEAMMKRTAVGDYSTPFQSQYGWHILQVEDMREQDVSDTVRRNMAREVLYQRLAPQAQEDWLQELRASSYVQIFE